MADFSFAPAGTGTVTGDHHLLTDLQMAISASNPVL